MRRAAVLLYLVAVCLPAFAQQTSSSVADLKRRREAIIASIQESQEELATTRKDKNATLSQLRALQSKLDARMQLIGNINEEMNDISGTITSSSQEVGQLSRNLELLKARYAQSLRYEHKNRSSYTMMAFLFSAKNYNDAMRRLKYLKRYRDYRKQQAEEIRNTEDRLQGKIHVLNTQKSQKEILLAAQEQQKQVLKQETNETNNVVNELHGREKELTAEIEKNKKAAKQAERAVNALIAREVAEQQRKAAEEARRQADAARRKEEADRNAAAVRNSANNGNNYGGVTLNTGSGSRNNNASNGPPNNGRNDNRPAANNPSASASVPTHTTRAAAVARDLTMTPETQALSNSFAANRGRLPWPVERGNITLGFGNHTSALSAKVTQFNNGIDIQTSAGAGVRAVFDGTVSGVFSIDGLGQNVLISHGAFFTVYQNLASVSVHKGDVVHTKQTIGTVGLNDDGLPTLNFQVWRSKAKGSETMNPALWIAQ